VWRLPFGLVLKKSTHDNPDIEAAALQFLEASKIAGVNFPHLVDHVSSTGLSFMLSTYISGIDGSDAWNDLSQHDWPRIEGDLHDQLMSLRRQSSSSNHRICSATGGVIEDPRIPWVAEQKTEINSTEEFFRQVWLGLDWPRNRDTIRPRIEPVIQRPVPIVFCHGDVFMKNFIFPGGLETWRAGGSRVYLIDWEYAGWMPEPWEALKCTSLECEVLDSLWIQRVRRILPQSSDYLNTDWLWRSEANVTIV
jgi:hypothetical protein